MGIDNLVARSLLPDWLIRQGIRSLLRGRLREQSSGGEQAQAHAKEAFIEQLKASPIAIDTDAANRQHYELPTAFYQLCLGKRLKYSSGLWPQGIETLDAAEEAMLKLTCERARIEDGQQILELGCGWGSLSLWLAEHFPRARITGVSNSASQRVHIEAECARRGLGDLQIITCDMNRFDTRRASIVCVDRDVRAYEKLPAVDGQHRSLAARRGLLFVHVFSHRRFAYHFVAREESDWMARYFFTGGLMPERRSAARFQRDLTLAAHWRVGGGIISAPPCLARQSGCQLGSGTATARRDLRRRAAATLVVVLAGVLHGLRGTLGFPRRHRMAGLALPVWQRQSANVI